MEPTNLTNLTINTIDVILEIRHEIEDERRAHRDIVQALEERIIELAVTPQETPTQHAAESRVFNLTRKALKWPEPFDGTQSKF